VVFFPKRLPLRHHQPNLLAAFLSIDLCKVSKPARCPPFGQCQEQRAAPCLATALPQKSFASVPGPLETSIFVPNSVSLMVYGLGVFEEMGVSLMCQKPQKMQLIDESKGPASFKLQPPSDSRINYRAAGKPFQPPKIFQNCDKPNDQNAVAAPSYQAKTIPGTSPP